MKKGLINYSKIKNLTVPQALILIADTGKLCYGDITIADLQIKEQLPEIKIFEKWEHLIFGYGVYIFFDKKVPLYVGKADSNFKHRFQSHRFFDGRKNYGFNKLARKVAEAKGMERFAYDKLEFYEKVIPLMNELNVIRINCMDSGINQTQCDRLEKLLMKGYSDKGVKLYNNVPKNVRKYDATLTIKQLMS